MSPCSVTPFGKQWDAHRVIALFGMVLALGLTIALSPCVGLGVPPG